jgi:hypothetical protein
VPTDYTYHVVELHEFFDPNRLLVAVLLFEPQVPLLDGGIHLIEDEVIPRAIGYVKKSCQCESRE